MPAWVAGAAAITAWGASQQQSGSRKQAQRQMRFQEHQSNTAYRRATGDMRAAGLNPILAAHGGASTSGGAMGQTQNVAGAGVASAMQAREHMQQLRNMKAQRETTTAQGNQAQTAAALNSLAYNSQLGAEERGLQEAAFYRNNPNFIAIEKWANLAGSGIGTAAKLFSFGRAGKAGKNFKPR